MLKSMCSAVLFLNVMMSGFSQTGKITAVVSNLKSDKGSCFFCLFNSSQGFPSDIKRAVKCANVAIKNGKATYTYSNLPSTTYALASYHDENNDGKLNTNFIGIPREGVGVSKNIIRSLGAPKFEDNKFVLENNGDLTFNIKMNY